MNFPLQIARRYLFSKKSTNAINVITGIAIFGVAVGTAAMLIILSVFNGFGDLFFGLFSNFNPDLKLTPIAGKTFDIDSTELAQLRQIASIQEVAYSLEEVAFFENKGQQVIGTFKGVDESYRRIVNIDSVIFDGEFRLDEAGIQYAVFGLGLASKLELVPNDYINVFMVKRKTRGPLDQPFRRKTLHPSGIFNFQQDFDQQYVIGGLQFAQELLDQPNTASALELRVVDGQLEKARAAVTTLLGDRFNIKDRYQQEAAAFKVLNIEKWLSFAILSLTILLVSFNIIGALWMIVLDKRGDLSILKAMGTTDESSRSIFWWLGVLLCSVGLLIGVALALLFYVLQTQFGIISVAPGAIISSYPIRLEFIDFVAVSCLVFAIGWLAALPAGWRAANISALERT